MQHRVDDDLYTPYVWPQENGNRHQVKWVSLTEANGFGLLASSSCGPDVLEKYRLRPEAFEFEVKFKSYSKNQCSPIELSKIQLQAMTEKQFV